jgi:hypothetical protein
LRSEAIVHLEFEELSLRSGGVGYGFFNGEAEIDDFGAPIVLEIEAISKGGENLRLDIAELVKERIRLRRNYGSSFLESDGGDVREHLKKWVLFHALSESLALQYKETINDLILDRWSTPHRDIA